MKGYIIIFAILFTVDCKINQKGIFYKLISKLKGTSKNFDTLYHNIKSPSLRYFYGISDENTKSQAIKKLEIKEENELHNCLDFMKEMGDLDGGAYQGFDCQVNKEQTGGICQGLYLLSTKERDDKVYFLAINFGDVTFDFKYKIYQRRVCKFLIFCRYEDVRVPIGGLELNKKFSEEGIYHYVYTILSEEILNNLID